MVRYIGFLVVCVLIGCNPSNKLVKQGDARQQAGNYDQASTFYYNALLHKRDNQKAKDGLAISAQ
jgi:hypothetical protein